MFSTLSKTKIIISVTLNLLSGIAFNFGLDQYFVIWQRVNYVSTLFWSYHSSLCNYPCFPGVHLNSLPNDKILDQNELKAFADDKINVAEMMISLSDRVENIVRKEGNADYQHFLTLFSMVSFAGS